MLEGDIGFDLMASDCGEELQGRARVPFNTKHTQTQRTQRRDCQHDFGCGVGLLLSVSCWRFSLVAGGDFGQFFPDDLLEGALVKLNGEAIG